MAGHGAPEQRPIDCHDLRVAVVAASWHTEVMDGLVAGARRALQDYRVEEPKVVRVPGTFELPSSPTRWRGRGTTPWSRSAWSSAAARRTSTTSARPRPTA